MLCHTSDLQAEAFEQRGFLSCIKIILFNFLSCIKRILFNARFVTRLYLIVSRIKCEDLTMRFFNSKFFNQFAWRVVENLNFASRCYIQQRLFACNNILILVIPFVIGKLWITVILILIVVDFVDWEIKWVAFRNSLSFEYSHWF